MKPPPTATERRWRLGRAADNDYVINHAGVSSHHAELIEESDGTVRIRDLDSRNGTFIGSSDTPVTEVKLQGDEVLRFSRSFPIPLSLLRQQLAAPQARPTQGAQVSLERDLIRIGRDPSCDVRLPLLTVSRQHAEIRRLPGGRIELRDLGSKIGTLVNGRAVRSETVEIAPDDLIEIGGHRISFFFQNQAAPAGRLAVERHGYTLQARDLQFRTAGRASRILLEHISLVVRPGEMVALMGPSGSGKSTLMNLLIGEATPTVGEIFYDQAELHSSSTSILPYIAHVPQEDLLNPHLTVRETLRAHALLKLPADVTSKEIDAKIDEVCRSMGLLDTERGIDLRDRLVGSAERRGLSGGQKKRVSLAMELLSDPKILFLDEPTSGLSSSDTRAVIQTLREIATSRSVAVVVTIHQPSLQIFRMFDLALYLKDGQLVYYGAAFPDAPAHFCPAQPAGEAGPDGIMETLDREETEQLARRYSTSPLPRRYFQGRWTEPGGGNRRSSPDARPTHASPWKQVRVVCFRDWRSKMRERLFLGVMAAQPLLIGGLIGQLFPHPAGPIEPATVAFLTSLVCFWLGLNLAARELVAERTRMRRERRGGLSSLAYLTAKLTTLSLLVLLQVTLLASLLGAQVHMHAWPWLAVVALGWITAVAGVATGLAISAHSSSEVSAVALVPLLLIPMILLAGHLKPYDGGLTEAPLARAAAALSPLRWSYEAISAVCLNPGSGPFPSASLAMPAVVLVVFIAVTLTAAWAGLPRR